MDSEFTTSSLGTLASKRNLDEKAIFQWVLLSSLVFCIGLTGIMTILVSALVYPQDSKDPFDSDSLLRQSLFIDAKVINSSSIEAMCTVWKRRICPKLARVHSLNTSACEGDSASPGELSCANFRHAWMADHVMLTPDVQSATLVVFLAGTGAPPNDYASLLHSARSAGHYVIGLAYLSAPATDRSRDSWCNYIGKEDDDKIGTCSDEMHERVLFGSASGILRGASRNFWNVDEANSVRSILLRALKQTSWGAQFLITTSNSSESRVDWSKIIISGHSQGAGHAAYLSHRRGVFAAVLFSGPQDCEQCCRRWTWNMKDDGVFRLALLHQKEECGPNSEIKNKCEHNRLLQNLETMTGESKREHATWSGDYIRAGDLQSKIVVSTARPSCKKSRRPYHDSIARDSCMSSNSVHLWKAMFAATLTKTATTTTRSTVTTSTSASITATSTASGQSLAWDRVAFKWPHFPKWAWLPANGIHDSNRQAV
jgi:hypothetical protein